jgi:hypothetical protein
MNSISDLDLDLENLLQPAWTQEKPEGNRYEKFSGDEGERPGRKREKRRADFSEDRGKFRPANRLGKKFGGKKDFHRGERRERERREPPASLPEIAVQFLADETGIEHLARQIKMTGRAYPLFQIAQLILQKPERYTVRLAVIKKANDAVAQPLFVCALDDTPWLNEDEAVSHVLKNHFATFYQAERTPCDPPKGVYTFVAQCGMSGVILGPPNYHDYQNQLRKLHVERFSKMPFDAFKSRVKIVKDEAVVKKWVEEQSVKTEYAALNVPEPLKLASFEEVEKHFRSIHKDNIIKSVELHLVPGVASRNLHSRELQRLVRAEWERQTRFPLALATDLSRRFATHGLQFFKVNKTVVHVNVARPQFLDLETAPVSENVRRIIGFIAATPKCTRRKMIESLAPSPKPESAPPVPGGEGTPRGEMSAAPQPAAPTPEQTALIADLHWLIHQGHVLEFTDGRLETAKKPAPKPPKLEAKQIEAIKPAEKSKPADEKSAEAEPVAEETTPPVGEMPSMTETTEAVAAMEPVEPVESPS